MLFIDYNHCSDKDLEKGKLFPPKGGLADSCGGRENRAQSFRPFEAENRKANYRESSSYRLFC